MSELQGQSIQLPCGCICASRIVDGEKQFVIQPCSDDCKNYKYAMEETARQGKPVRHEVGELKGKPKDL